MTGMTNNTEMTDTQHKCEMNTRAEYDDWIVMLDGLVEPTLESDYTEMLLLNSEHILKDLRIYQQRVVADRLGLKSPILSTYRKLLAAYYNLHK